MSPAVNYWDAHPDMRYVFPSIFAMEDGSKIMHCIEMYVDPRNDIAMETDDSRRLAYIKEYHSDFNPSDFESEIDTYLSLIPEVEIDYINMLKDTRSQLKMLTDIKIDTNPSSYVEDVADDGVDDGIGAPGVKKKAKKKSRKKPPSLIDIMAIARQKNDLVASISKTIDILLKKKKDVMESRRLSNTNASGAKGYTPSRAELGGIGQR